MNSRFALEVYYDNWCPLCTGTKERLQRLDWLHLLRFVPIREGDVAAHLGVEQTALERRMHARAPHTGRVVDGIDAVAAIAVRLPLLMPLWPMVALAAHLGVGQRAYDWIAARRTIVPVGQCKDDHCPIHPRGR